MPISVYDLRRCFLTARNSENLNAPIEDTGNAMTDDKIMNLSKMLDVDALLAYRNAVGKRTQEIVKSL